MRIYIAAPYAARDALRENAFQLEALGHECTATWLKASHAIAENTLGTAPAMDDDYAVDHAAEDMEDVLRSDALVLVCWETAVGLVGPDSVMGPNSGGRHVESGIALAQGIPVIVWGEPENIFHRGNGFHPAPTWGDVLEHVEGIQAARFGRAVSPSVPTGKD